MKKAGAIAARFGVHPDTVRDWADMFEEFFSPGAKKGAGVRRVFDLQDEMVLNTVYELRKRNVEFEEIRARLRSGERIEVLPVVNEPLQPESAVELYGKLRSLESLLQEKDKQIEQLRTDLAAERAASNAALAAERSAISSERDKLRDELAVLRYQLEQLRGKKDDE